MSLIPITFDNTSRIFDQHFGMGMDINDLFTSMAMPPSIHRHYFRPWRSLTRVASRVDSGSKITIDKNKYQVCLDIQQFTPEEITVKTIGDEIVIEGKHEEKEDEHGHISRHFIRKYHLPKEYRPEDVTSTLSSDGVLNISAPRFQKAIEEKERIVPIKITDPVHKTIKEQTKEDQKMEQ